MSEQDGPNGKGQPRQRDLARSLLWFQIFMIGASATIGLGIFIRSGEVLEAAGPAGTILAFGLMGFVSICAMDGIAEMVELWPVSNPFREFVASFVDEDLGTVVSFAYWYTYAMGFQSLLVSAAGVLSIWIDPEDHKEKLLLYQQAILYFLSPLFLLGLNFMGVFWVGMVETILGITKIAFLVAAFILMVATEYRRVGTAPQNTGVACLNDGFRANGAVATGRFEAFCIAVSTAAFGFIGVETVAMTAYEARTRKDVKLPARLIAWSITGLYLLSVLGSVLNVSWKDQRLPHLYSGQETNPAGPISCIESSELSKRAAHFAKPPIVIALENVQSRTARNAIAGCLIFVVLSAANAALYVSSRTLFGLTQNIDEKSGYPIKALTWLAFVTKPKRHGSRVLFGQIPAGALIFSMLIFYWTPFVNNEKVLAVLSAMGTVGCLLVWASQALAYIRFDRLRRRYGHLRPKLRHKRTFGQPVYAYVALVSCLVIVFVLNTASWWIGGGIEPSRVLQVFVGPVVLLILWIALKCFRSRPTVLEADSEQDRFLSVVDMLNAKAEDIAEDVEKISMNTKNNSEGGSQGHTVDTEVQNTATGQQS